MWVRSTAAGISDPIFWTSTPAEVRDLWRELHRVRTDRERMRREREEHLVGLVICEIRNQWLRKGKRPWTPDRLWRRRGEGEGEAPVDEAELQVANFRAFADAMNRRRPGSIRVREIH